MNLDFCSLSLLCSVKPLKYVNFPGFAPQALAAGELFYSNEAVHHLLLSASAAV